MTPAVFPVTQAKSNAKAGSGARLSILVLHDDAQREYAYGPAQGLRTPKSARSRRLYTTRR